MHEGNDEFRQSERHGESIFSDGTRACGLVRLE